MKNFFSTVVSLSLLSGVAGLIAWIAGTSWGLTVLLVSVGVLLLSAVVLSSITDAEEQAKLAAMSPEEREKYEAEKAAEKKEKIQQAEHQKHVKKSQNFSTADVKSVLRLLDSGSGWKWCPICDAKLNYIEGYQIERVVNVAKPIKGVYVPTGWGAEVTEAVRFERESRAFGAKVVTCPYCEYTLYYAEAEDEVEDKSDIHRAISLGRPPVENKRYLNRAISLGRLPKDKYDHIMKWDPEFKKERFDSPSDFIKKY